MARPSNEFLMAGRRSPAPTPSPGWQAIAPVRRVVAASGGRRSPDNAEAVLVCFPSAKLAAADKLPRARALPSSADPDGSGRFGSR